MSRYLDPLTLSLERTRNWMEIYKKNRDAHRPVQQGKFISQVSRKKNSKVSGCILAKTIVRLQSSRFLNCLPAAPLSEQRRNHELGDATRNSKNEVGAEITSCSNPKISSWSCPVIAYCVRAPEWLRVRINLKYTKRVCSNEVVAIRK